MSIPPPAITQAIKAPNGPVARPNVAGRDKIPAPTMEPTTIAVSISDETCALRELPRLMMPPAKTHPLSTTRALTPAANWFPTTASCRTPECGPPVTFVARTEGSPL